MNIYTAIAYSSWIVVGLVWLPGYFFTKRTAERPDRARQLGAHLFLIVGAALVFYSSKLGPVLSARITPKASVFEQIGLALDLIGILFTIWARLTLGRNWSNVMTLKENHELVQTGPYSIVRHPIYVGLLLGALGTAMTMGALAAYLGVILLLIGYLIRIQSEDALMAEQFPDTHPTYRQRTRKLIPYLW
jgi:protein-S-isoprenylcysteine O-methyltransferase Ste14